MRNPVDITQKTQPTIVLTKSALYYKSRLMEHKKHTYNQHFVNPSIQLASPCEIWLTKYKKHTYSWVLH